MTAISPARSDGSARRPRRGGRAFATALPYLAPALLLYGLFLVYPMVDSVRLSFFQWSGFRTEEQVFVGLDNYVRLLTADPVFWTALRNSVIWVVASLLVPTVIALLLALGLNRPMIGRNVMRAVF
ncbi:carbohydrate ABC transporter permease [Brachybacterium paraconglomeratum]|uniref:carbohydrate ABC transporter permease n=1 Tax=Brachybacterium paraconglomeratum TaxID=173362 RepID=UPI0035144C4E